MNEKIAIADSEPADTLMGHPVGEDVNFNFTYTGSDVWVKFAPNPPFYRAFHLFFFNRVYGGLCGLSNH